VNRWEQAPGSCTCARECDARHCVLWPPPATISRSHDLQGSFTLVGRGHSELGVAYQVLDPARWAQAAVEPAGGWGGGGGHAELAACSLPVVDSSLMTSTTYVFIPILSSARAPVPVRTSTTSTSMQQPGNEEGDVDGRPSRSGAPTATLAEKATSGSTSSAANDKLARLQRKLYGLLYWRREGGGHGDGGAPSFTGPEADLMTQAARHVGLLVDASQGLDLLPL
jgi:hypothetical protein